MDLAVFGGTFNPLHVGHIALAKKIKEDFSVERMVLVPANIPSHKVFDGDVTPRQRLEMVRIAIEGTGLECSGCEIDRGGISYTYDTIQHLAAPGTQEVGLVIGDDLVPGLGRWHRADELFSIVDLIVVRRSDGVPPSLPSNARYVDDFRMTVSSSEVRLRIAERREWETLVPEGVAEYIKAHGLYGYRP